MNTIATTLRLNIDWDLYLTQLQRKLDISYNKVAEIAKIVVIFQYNSLKYEGRLFQSKKLKQVICS